MQGDLQRELAGYSPTEPAQQGLRLDALALVSGDPRTHLRTNPVHLTAGAVVLDPSGTRTLLVLHRKVGRWLQPGGHLELADLSPAAAALREVREETGVVSVRLLPGIVDLDRHPAPGGAQEHLDLRWCAVAPVDAVPVWDSESLAARWFDVDDLPAERVPLERLLAAAQKRLLSWPVSF